MKKFREQERLFPPEGALVEFTNPKSHFLPGDLVNLMFALLLQIFEEALIVANAVNGICQSMDIPIIYLETVV